MVVDVDDEAALEPGDAGAPEVAAFHHDHRVARIVDALRDLDVVDGRKYAQRRRGRIAIDHARFLAHRTQRERHGYLRADRVAVGAHV